MTRRGKQKVLWKGMEGWELCYLGVQYLPLFPVVPLFMWAGKVNCDSSLSGLLQLEYNKIMKILAVHIQIDMYIRVRERKQKVRKGELGRSGWIEEEKWA